MECHKCATPIPENSRFCLSCGADVSGEGAERTMAVDAGHELMMQLQGELGDEYQLEKELGRGGMAIVYLGHDARLGRKVAVKVLPPELTFGAGPHIIERFKREARTSATLDHPNIIPVYRVSPGGKLFWYVMKYLDGEPLDKTLQREGQLPLDRTVEIVRQVAEGLDFAHHNQVVHRDIKPANVVIDTRGRVTVTDFGIAKALDSNALTASGSMIGTPYYMSPEQCAGKKVGPASDQYSMAVMTFQMLGGHLPFTGESVVDIVRQHVMDPVPPLGVLRPSLPAAVVKVVERGLAKHADERFPSCSEFARALASAVEGKEVPASKTFTSGERMSRTAMLSPVPGALRVAHATWSPARKAGVVLGAVLALGAAGAATWPLVVARKPVPVRQPLATAPAVVPPPAPATVTDSTGTDSAAPSTAPPATVTEPAASRDGQLILSGVPAGARVLRDQRPVSGPVAGRVGRIYDINVQAPGYETWQFTWRPRGGTERQSVRMTAIPGAAPLTAQATPPSTAPGTASGTATPNTAPGSATPNATPPRSQSAPPTTTSPQTTPGSPPAAPGGNAVGYLTIGSSPGTASLTINGRPVRNPASRYEVPAGPVLVRFTWTDSTGSIRTQEITVTVAAGQPVVHPRVVLRSP